MEKSFMPQYGLRQEQRVYIILDNQSRKNDFISVSFYKNKRSTVN